MVIDESVQSAQAKGTGQLSEEAQESVQTVPIGSLLPADSPRLAGLSEDHVQVLAESGAEFEPILVHRADGRVIDGMHRLKAAVLRGERDIAVRYIDVPAADVFIRSVQANIRHGLPLTLRDRKAAVMRILGTHSHWSDRAIAKVAGVSPKTVGAARTSLSSEESPHSNPPIARVGRDGRVRPVDISERREKALGLLAEQPGATLREVAREAGISISTAHRLRQEVRAGLSDGEATAQSAGPMTAFDREEPSRAVDVMVPTQRGRTLASVPDDSDPSPAKGVNLRIRALEALSNDPSIRFTDSGRTLLRWLNGQARGLVAAEQLLAGVPPHCAQALAEVATHYARTWDRLAEELQHMDRGDVAWREAR
ncbi:ParB/RepB/Spo0J family partition protein [Streptacidiphilus melanogenes]|uniref:ParB/RepB/Spo0J family partition protein n=1 Tax=Streptacidiphilus melanogenes TaxID=411235 RepID=UPI000A05FF68|nr:helix-turn-helix domain-containing protein [Streptacidiphilus melanogenes]